MNTSLIYITSVPLSREFLLRSIIVLTKIIGTSKYNIGK